MKIEQIKQAAKETVQDLFQCNGKYPCEERNYCEFCNGHNSAFDCKEDCGADDFNEGFIAGAQWRINSVWHKPSQNGEELVAGRMVIAKFKEGYVFGKFDEGEIYKRTLIFLSRSFIEYPLSEVLEYAYLDDLLPERKEGTE